MEPQEKMPSRELAPVRAQGERRTTMRVIRTAGKPIILIYESEPPATTQGPRALVFESGQWSTSIDHYPPDWRFLPDEELLRLQPQQQT